jgi:hypothetical protein
VKCPLLRDKCAGKDCVFYTVEAEKCCLLFSALLRLSRLESMRD